VSTSVSNDLFVVIVDFVVHAEQAGQFAVAMAENAEASRTLEVGCIQFDVCRPDNDGTRFFLYELYTDKAAFQTHLQTPHFLSFDAMVTPWVVDKRVQTMTRISP
jgi:(4S)-4-hydroxy-5-phosphonooxypentane-2,3-dione isomerase